MGGYRVRKKFQLVPPVQRAKNNATLRRIDSISQRDCSAALPELDFIESRIQCDRRYVIVWGRTSVLLYVGAVLLIAVIACGTYRYISDPSARVAAHQVLRDHPWQWAFVILAIGVSIVVAWLVMTAGP